MFPWSPEFALGRLSRRLLRSALRRARHRGGKPRARGLARPARHARGARGRDRLARRLRGDAGRGPRLPAPAHGRGPGPGLRERLRLPQLRRAPALRSAPAPGRAGRRERVPSASTCRSTASTTAATPGCAPSPTARCSWASTTSPGGWSARRNGWRCPERHAASAERPRGPAHHARQRRPRALAPGRHRPRGARRWRGLHAAGRPGRPLAELRHLLSGVEVRVWGLRELERLQRALGPSELGAALADGGELVQDVGEALPRDRYDALLGEMLLEP